MEANEPKKEQNTEEMDVMKQFIQYICRVICSCND